MMPRNTRRRLKGIAAVPLLFAGLIAPPAVSAQTDEETVKLRLMETADIHVHIVNYDYYKDQTTDEFGLAKTAALIKQARAEAPNSMLFDNGDLIQGNPLGDFVARVKPLKDGDIHPVYKAMNQLGYDAGNIGNHDFNYGLDFLKRSLKGAAFPYVNANVYIDDHDSNPNNDQNAFTPYVILDKTVRDEAGREHQLKVGVIGFVPPQIMQWDKENLEGKVIAKDIVETAKRFIPEMKAKGADLIIAVPHSGFDQAAPKGFDENAVYYLSKVPGIDAILFGHAHRVFPGSEFAGIPGVDAEKGTINGVPAVMPGYWGNHLGIIDLTLKRKDGKWMVADAQSKAVPIYDTAAKKPLVDADPAIVEAVRQEHEGALAYIRSAVAKTTAPIYSYFALVQDDPSVQLVNNAQTWYVEQHVKGTEYEGIPVLSAAAPFKAGGRNGASYYTDIPAGTIAIKNVADLYIYPNTLKAVLVNGAQLKEWLEMAAGQFNQIDPHKRGEQPLINRDFPTYNFDVIDGVTYRIDVTQPARYDAKGNLVNPSASRIQDLRYQGKPVTPDQRFIVATNNYRASGGGNFPGLKGDNIVIDSPDENRQILVQYLASQQTINPSADGNWSLAPVPGDATVTFESSPSARPYADKLPTMKYLRTLDSGFSVFALDLSGRQAATKPALPIRQQPAPHALVPVRSTAEAAGIQVAYDQTTRTVTLSKGNKQLVYVLGASQAMINGKPTTVSSRIVNQRLYLPAAVLETAFGISLSR